MASLEHIGTVTTRSGGLIVIDTGYLGIWLAQCQLIVRAIVAGQRHPWKLVELSHPRIQASRAEIAKSLEGHWRQELLFVLQQEIEMDDTYQRRVEECDQELQKHPRVFADTATPVNEELPRKRR
jgi:hypothetical protein